MSRVRIALVGAGSIGRKHAAALAGSARAELAAVVDPAPEAVALAAARGVPHCADLGGLPAGIDGAILATPTGLHYAQALECLERRLPVLIEKPVTATLEEALHLAAEAARTGVPALVGHHRRHNPRIAAAREALGGGRIGRVVSAQVSVLLCKPDDYFRPEWRRKKGAGPLLTNLIHEIDTLRFLLGEVASVSALASNAIRGHEVEDSAAVLIRFASGALATVVVSDAAAAPWSWELTASENPDYPETGQSCIWIAGTEGALELPGLKLWRHDGTPSWFTPMTSTSLPVVDADPLARQIEHFADVIAAEAAPLVSIEDAARSMAVLDAVLRAASSSSEVTTT